MAYAKVNSVAIAALAKIGNIAKAGFGKIAGVDAPADAFSNTYSLDFDGANDYMEAVGGTNMTLDICSYGMWIKTSAVGAGTPFMLHQAFYLYMISTPSGYAVWVNHPIGLLNTSTTDVGDGAWHFLCATIEGGSGVSSSIKLYIDGVLNVTKTATTTYTVVTNEDLKIGRFEVDSSGWAGLNYNGNLDEVAVWDVTLDADAVTQLYNSGEPIDLKTDSGNYDNSGDLIHWWRMGDGDTYPTIEDNVGSYDFTMTNMAAEDIVEVVPS